MPHLLNRLVRQRNAPSPPEKLYGAIVAQARLPVFYAEYGVPDTLDGRFAVLSLHLFVLLRRLKQGGAAASTMAQDLIDRFALDMETVLREIGVSDLRIPKKMRGLAASSHALFESYDQASCAGERAFQAVIAESLPLESLPARAASLHLTPYLRTLRERLEAQPLARLLAGEFASVETEDGDAKG
jgi:cytochrome b pre-mRNA-processing protein 3